MKSAGKARNNGLYRHIRTSKEIIRNLLNDCNKKLKEMSIYFMGFALFFSLEKEKMILGYCAKIQGKEDAP